MTDISPQFDLQTQEEELVLPDQFQDTPSQIVGGMVSQPDQLSQGKVFIQGTAQRILIGDATAPLTGIGVFIGNDGAATVGYDFRVGNPAGNYMHWDESAGSLTVVGTISVTAGGTIGGFDVGSDYIRDVANSFGLASTVSGSDDVRFWAGDTFANRATAPFRVTEAGVVVAKSISIGGASIQYTVTNAGIFSFGDGSDGAAVFNGTDAVTGYTRSGTTYTADRDVYYTDMTVSTGVTVKPAGYRIFGTGTLTLEGTAVIQRNGNAGSAPTDAGGASGGAALADGYLKGSVAGANGGTGNGPPDPGFAGTATSNSIGSSGAAGGAGGAGTLNAGGAGGAAGTATASNVRLIANWHLATLLDIGSTGATVKFDNSAGSGGGGGAGQGTGPVNGRGGAGAGSSGAILAIYFRVIVIGASASITANGGAGGNGGDGQNNGSGGSGGGGGGNGGQVILVYNTLTNSGSITAAGGAGGTGGAANSGGSAGTAGTAGTAGNVRQFQISM